MPKALVRDGRIFAASCNTWRGCKSIRVCRPGWMPKGSSRKHCSRALRGRTNSAARSQGKRRPGCGPSSCGVLANELRRLKTEGPLTRPWKIRRRGWPNSSPPSSRPPASRPSATRLPSPGRGPVRPSRTATTGRRARRTHGWSLAAISEHLDASTSAVAGLLNRGLRQLRDTLAETD